MYKKLNGKIWFRITALILVGLFLCQPAAYARNFRAADNDPYKMMVDQAMGTFKEQEKQSIMNLGFMVVMCASGPILGVAGQAMQTVGSTMSTIGTTVADVGGYLAGPIGEMAGSTVGAAIEPIGVVAGSGVSLAGQGVSYISGFLGTDVRDPFMSNGYLNANGQLFIKNMGIAYISNQVAQTATAVGVDPKAAQVLGALAGGGFMGANAALSSNVALGSNSFWISVGRSAVKNGVFGAMSAYSGNPGAGMLGSLFLGGYVDSFTGVIADQMVGGGPLKNGAWLSAPDYQNLNTRIQQSNNIVAMGQALQYAAPALAYTAAGPLAGPLALPYAFAATQTVGTPAALDLIAGPELADSYKQAAIFLNTQQSIGAIPQCGANGLPIARFYLNASSLPEAVLGAFHSGYANWFTISPGTWARQLITAGIYAGIGSKDPAAASALSSFAGGLAGGIIDSGINIKLPVLGTISSDEFGKWWAGGSRTDGSGHSPWFSNDYCIWKSVVKGGFYSAIDYVASRASSAGPFGSLAKLYASSAASAFLDTVLPTGNDSRMNAHNPIVGISGYHLEPSIASSFNGRGPLRADNVDPLAWVGNYNVNPEANRDTSTAWFLGFKFVPEYQHLFTSDNFLGQFQSNVQEGYRSAWMNLMPHEPSYTSPNFTYEDTAYRYNMAGFARPESFFGMIASGLANGVESAAANNFSRALVDRTIFREGFVAKANFPKGSMSLSIDQMEQLGLISREHANLLRRESGNPFNGTGPLREFANYGPGQFLSPQEQATLSTMPRTGYDLAQGIRNFDGQQISVQVDFKDYLVGKNGIKEKNQEYSNLIIFSAVADPFILRLRHRDAIINAPRTSNNLSPAVAQARHFFTQTLPTMFNSLPFGWGADLAQSSRNIYEWRSADEIRGIVSQYSGGSTSNIDIERVENNSQRASMFHVTQKDWILSDLTVLDQHGREAFTLTYNSDRSDIFTGMHRLEARFAQRNREITGMPLPDLNQQPTIAQQRFAINVLTGFQTNNISDTISIVFGAVPYFNQNGDIAARHTTLLNNAISPNVRKAEEWNFFGYGVINNAKEDMKRGAFGTHFNVIGRTENARYVKVEAGPEGISPQLAGIDIDRQHLYDFVGRAFRQRENEFNRQVTFRAAMVADAFLHSPSFEPEDFAPEEWDALQTVTRGDDGRPLSARAAFNEERLRAALANYFLAGEVARESLPYEGRQPIGGYESLEHSSYAYDFVHNRVLLLPQWSIRNVYARVQGAEGLQNLPLVAHQVNVFHYDNIDSIRTGDQRHGFGLRVGSQAIRSGSWNSNELRSASFGENRIPVFQDSRAIDSYAVPYEYQTTIYPGGSAPNFTDNGATFKPAITAQPIDQELESARPVSGGARYNTRDFASSSTPGTPSR